MLELVDTGWVREETDSDYEWPFTSYWWKFRCPHCSKEIYCEISYSVLEKGEKLRCDACKHTYTTKDSFVCGKKKKPY